MKKCCKKNKKFFGKNKNWKICPNCKHIYFEETDLTVRCKCENFPIKK